MKRFATVLLVAVMALTFAAGAAYADKDKRGKGMDLEDKLFKKAGIALMSKDELGLTDKQVKQIKSLKLETKKKLIQNNADIEIAAVDIKGYLWEEPLNVKAAYKQIDRKYEVKKAKAKTLVGALADFNKILTTAQKDQLKQTCKEKIQKKCKAKDKPMGMGMCKSCGQKMGK